MTKWLEIAWEAQGVKEVHGPGANPDIIAFFKDAGHAEITSDETAWCAAFVGACLHRAGVTIDVPKLKRLMARSYLEQGTPIEKARVGAIAVITRGDASGWQGHVGFVVGETETHLAILGGNQADAVTVAHFPKAKLLGLRWPEPARKPSQLSESRIARAAARQVKDAGKTTVAPMVPAPPVPAAPHSALEALPSPEALAGKAQAFQGAVESLAGFAQFAGQKWSWIVAGVSLYFAARMAWDAWQIRQWRASDANEGKTVA